MKVIVATTAATRARPALKVFISYSRKDDPMRATLENHLAGLVHQHLIELLSDRKIQAGQKWRDAIGAQLEQADLILLLITHNFMGSDYIWRNEVPRALERSKAGDAIVIPILLSHIYLASTPFGELQALPPGARPIADWGKKKDEGYAKVTEGIKERIEDYWARREMTERVGPAQAPAERAPMPGAPHSPPPSPLYDTKLWPTEEIPERAKVGERSAEPLTAHPAIEDIANPYDFEHPATRYFRGRQEELAELTSHLKHGKSALVLGLQRMGKTSLVERALDLLTNDTQTDRKFIVLGIDMFSSWMSFNSYMDFFYTVVNLLSEHLAKSLPESEFDKQRFRNTFSEQTRSAYDIERYELLKSTLKGARQRLQAPIILFFDEFQELEKVFQRARERKTSDPFDAGLMRWIGSLAKEQTIQLLICSRYRALQMEEGERLEIFKTLHRIHVGALDESPARALVRDPAAANKISYQEEATKTILELSGRLPYLIQLLCSKLMNTPAVRRTKEVRKRDVEEIAGAILKDPSSRMNLGVLYTDFKEMENERPWKALCALAHLAATAGQHVALRDIEKRLTEHDSIPNAAGITADLMERLVTAGIVKETGQGRLRTYQLRPDLLRLWVRKRHTK